MRAVEKGGSEVQGTILVKKSLHRSVYIVRTLVDAEAVKNALSPKRLLLPLAQLLPNALL